MGSRERGHGQPRPGGQACGAQDWATAAAHFDAVAAERLSADDLAAYADAVWWLGRIEDTLRLRAVYHAFLADSRAAEAARTATMLGILHTARGDEPQALGWLGRAGRLAEDVPECAAHGYLVNFTVVETATRVTTRAQMTAVR